MNTILLSFILCLTAELHHASLHDVVVIMSEPIDAEPQPSELVATRSTTVHVQYQRPPGRDEDVPYRTVEDTVEVFLTTPELERMVLWTKSKRVGWSLDMEHMMERLVLYDAFYNDGIIWVLYSVDSRVFLDRVAKHEDGTYGVEKSVNVATLNRASFLRPYVIETGKILRHDDSIILVAYLPSYRAHDRQHPYVFWEIEDDSPTEIDDLDLIEELRKAVGDELEGDRPRMSTQMKPPWVSK